MASNPYSYMMHSQHKQCCVSPPPPNTTETFLEASEALPICTDSVCTSGKPYLIAKTKFYMKTNKQTLIVLTALDNTQLHTTAFDKTCSNE